MFAGFCKKGVQMPRGEGEKLSNRFVDMMKMMMQSKSTPYGYWAEAMNMAIYLLNRSPNKAVIESMLIFN